MSASVFETSPVSEDLVVPPVPESIADTGVPGALIEQLIVKILYFRGELLGRDLSQALGLKFSVIEDIIETLKRQHMITAKRSLGIGNMSAMFTLAEPGRNAARDSLEMNQYSGPTPVPLHQYTAVVRRQRHPEKWLTPEGLRRALKHLVVTPEVLNQVGPAVNAGKSFLIYGQPGNGKTALAESLFRIESTPIYVPYAIECQGNVIQVFDPIYHQRIDDEESVFSAVATEPTYDHRWFRAKRPFIISGGELTLGMLDLSYNESSKIYDAPFQVKANNGIYLIDDFGRQRATPAEVLNRWVVPMERHVDYLSFRTGGKMTVPFEAFLLFSTNLRPDQLGDEAFLRRIQYKMLVRNPAEDEYRKIFDRFCDARALECAEGALDRMIANRYKAARRPMRRCQPRDLISHAIDFIQFEDRPWLLDDEVLDRAWESCFADSRDLDG